MGLSAFDFVEPIPLKGNDCEYGGISVEKLPPTLMSMGSEMKAEVKSLFERSGG